MGSAMPNDTKHSSAELVLSHKTENELHLFIFNERIFFFVILILMINFIMINYKFIVNFQSQIVAVIFYDFMVTQNFY